MLRRESSVQFVRFVAVGIVNTGITFVSFTLLSAVLHYTLIYVIVFVMGIGISYVLNTRFAFYEQIRIKTMLIYPIVYIIQLIIGIVLLSLLVEQFGINHLIANLIVIGGTLPITFVASRFIIKQMITT
jgi:putative flippase GtrA